MKCILTLLFNDPYMCEKCLENEPLLMYIQNILLIYCRNFHHIEIAMQRW